MNIHNQGGGPSISGGGGQGAAFSYYSSIFAKNPNTTDLDSLIAEVKSNKHKELCDQIRAANDPENRKKLKAKLPAVTVSGTFPNGKRGDKDLQQHSKLIAIDFDGLSEKQIKAAWQPLTKCSYVQALFRSAGGNLCAICRVDPRKHREAFGGLQNYFYKNYDLVVDSSGVNESRLRFLSHDPGAYLNQAESPVFRQYPPRPKKEKIKRYLVTQSDFENILSQISERQIDLARDDYHTWLRLGFAIADEFNEAGRNIFHNISQFGSKYNPESCDAQYNNCLRSAPGSRVTIATFYFYCKEAGVELNQKKNIQAIETARQQAKNNVSQTDIVDWIEEHHQIPYEEALVIASEAPHSDRPDDISKIEALELYVNSTYLIRKNEITRKIEVDGEELTTSIVNSVWLEAMKKVDDKITKAHVEAAIDNNKIQIYNPLKEFFNLNYLGPGKHAGYIEQVIDCMDSPQERDYLLLFFKKWIVAMVAGWFDHPNEVMMVLCGDQKIAKTKFSRNLLPSPINEMRAESKLDRGKDDEILMCHSPLIIDDEFAGKSKNDYRKLKDYLSKDYFTLREPYGKYNVRLRRIASLIATSNEFEVINDPTGNRRIVPLHLIDFDLKRFLDIDKISLICEAYDLFKSGWVYWLENENIALLDARTDEFKDYTTEYELVQQFISPPSAGKITHLWSNSEVMQYISEQFERNPPRINHVKLGTALRMLIGDPVIKKVDGKAKRCYEVTLGVTEDYTNIKPSETFATSDSTPF